MDDDGEDDDDDDVDVDGDNDDYEDDDDEDDDEWEVSRSDIHQKDCRNWSLAFRTLLGETTMFCL